MCKLPPAHLQVLTSILLLHRRGCDRSQASRLRKKTEALLWKCFTQCKTSLAGSPELRVKSAVNQLAVPVSCEVPWAPSKYRMWSSEPLPAMPSCSLGGKNQQSPATESRSKGANLISNTTQQASAAKLVSGRTGQSLRRGTIPSRM